MVAWALFAFVCVFASLGGESINLNDESILFHPIKDRILFLFSFSSLSEVV